MKTMTEKERIEYNEGTDALDAVDLIQTAILDLSEEWTRTRPTWSLALDPATEAVKDQLYRAISYLIESRHV